jgi:hypothetical protein
MGVLDTTSLQRVEEVLVHPVKSRHTNGFHADTVVDHQVHEFLTVDEHAVRGLRQIRAATAPFVRSGPPQPGFSAP